MTDDDNLTPNTPAELLVELGEFHTRTCVSPLPRQPAAMGWQALAGSMAAGFARALHALAQLSPEQAAEITAWFQGPFGDGPVPEDHTDWLEQHVAHGDPAVIERWVQDGREMAVKSQEATDAQAAVAEATAAREPAAAEHPRDVHTYLGLSYANYLVLPRTLLQSMPAEWQAPFVALLGEMDTAFAHVPRAEAYDVIPGTEALVGELGPDRLAWAGITQDFYDEPVPEDLDPFDLAEWKEEHAKAAPSYHRIKDGAELDADAYAFVPGTDPVPHYNRGRTRIEPHSASAEERNAE
ncbi:hypothetical protein [Streptomyces sp. NPDC001205]